MAGYSKKRTCKPVWRCPPDFPYFVKFGHKKVPIMPRFYLRNSLFVCNLFKMYMLRKKPILYCTLKKRFFITITTKWDW